MKMTTRQLRILVWSRKRMVTDTISWSIFFLLSIGFFTLFLWQQYEVGKVGEGFDTFLHYVAARKKGTPEQVLWKDAFMMIVSNGLAYTGIMMLPVYFNLYVQKPFWLDGDFSKIKRYGGYLLSTLAISLFVAGCLHVLLKHYPWFLKVHLDFLVNVAVIFGVMLISTGMMYLREADELSRKMGYIITSKEKFKQQLHQTMVELEKAQMSISRNHIKVGSKNHFDIIPLDEILYLQGDGNTPIIFTISGEEHWGCSRLKDYEDQLPTERFIRVHKSYLVAKDKVRGRRNNKLILQHTTQRIPIGETYLKIIDQDEILGNFGEEPSQQGG